MKRCLVAWIGACLIALVGCFEGTAGDAGTAGVQGTQGDLGETGDISLVSVTTEVPGANCQNGGKRIETGVDTNNNGLLDSEEVTETTYVCTTTAAVWYGDYYIETSADIATLSSYTIVTGDLYICNTSLTNLTGLENLSTVGGTLEISYNSTLANTNGLNNVSTVGWVFIGHNDNLTSISLNNIKRTEYVAIGSNAHLITVSFNNLIDAPAFEIIYNDLLQAISFNALCSVGVVATKPGGYFHITQNPMLCTTIVTALVNQVKSCGGTTWSNENFTGNKVCP